MDRIKIFVVTNRKLCVEPLTDRIEKLADCDIDAVIVREKDLPSSEYASLIDRLRPICEKRNVECIIHAHTDLAQASDTVWLSVEEMRKGAVGKFGVSVHSVAEAQEAERSGASYVAAGHIYDTDCKRGVPGRGVGFLKEVVSAVKIPALAIGGITPNNISGVIKCGAKGVCIMSSAMTSEDPKEYITKLRRAATK